MAENSNIEWTSHTFNPWRGCTKVSAGCSHCYAETLSGRNPGTLGVWGPNGTRVVAAESQWKMPVKWNLAAANCERMNAKFFPGMKHERPRVFCASLADVFEDWHGPMRNAAGQPMFARPNGEWAVPPMVPGEQWRHLDMQDVRRRLFALIDATPNLDWLVLTKRPDHAKHWLAGSVVNGVITGNPHHAVWPFDNVWLGTSIENQDAVRNRIPVLLDTPAKIHFLSVEPLLGEIDISDYLYVYPTRHKGKPWPYGRIDWVIVGGESGSGARPCRVAWIRSIVEQCKAAGVPVFVKQLGAFIVDRNDAGFDANAEVWAEGPDEGKPTNPRAWPDMPDIEEDLDGTRDGYQGAPVRVRLVDKKGGDMTEWPEDLRVREFPVRATA